MSVFNRFIFFMIPVILSGCMSFSDKAISAIQTGGSLLQEGQPLPQVYYFDDNATYRTNEGFNKGAEKLSTLILGDYIKNTALVKFDMISRSEFTVDFIDENQKIIQARHFIFKENFDLSNNGEITIRSRTSCGSHDSPGIGCQWSSVKLFKDNNGNLVAIQSSGGAGLATIIPMAVSSNYVSIFEQAKNMPTNEP